jgi:cytochrome b561
VRYPNDSARPQADAGDETRWNLGLMLRHRAIRVSLLLQIREPIPWKGDVIQMEDRQTYSAAARQFHWWTVAAVSIQLPLGIAMAVRGDWLDIWDSLTDNMYSTHKVLGVIVFFIVAARLCYRLSRGAPDDEPTLEPWDRLVSHITHWLIYALLFIVPLVGWFGVQLYPALEVFGLFSLPSIVSPDKAMSEYVLDLHGILAYLLLFLLGAHVAAALFHHFIRKDGVLHRMIPIIAAPKH